MIQPMLTIWSLVPLPFLHQAWTSASLWRIHVIIHLSKPIEYTTRVNPNINYGLWSDYDVTMCQYRFISCNKYTTSGNVDNREAMRVWEQRIYGKFLYLTLNFSVILKLLETINLRNFFFFTFQPVSVTSGERLSGFKFISQDCFFLCNCRHMIVHNLPKTPIYSPVKNRI